MTALLPRFVVFWSGALLVPWYVALRGLLAAGGRERREERDRVVVVAGRARGAWTSAASSTDAPERPASIVVGPAARGRRRGSPSAVATPAPTVLVLDRAAQDDERSSPRPRALHDRGVRVRTLSLSTRSGSASCPLAELERVSLMFDIGELHRASVRRG